VNAQRDPAAVWGPRLCAAAPFVVAASVFVGLFDPHGMDPDSGENLLAAIALAVASAGVALALLGGFMCLYAGERVPGFVRPKWATACAIAGIAGGFGAGLLALIT
jgi:hypothetical protein